MKQKIYIYPLTAKDCKLGLYNPYIDDLIKSFEEYYTFENLKNPSSSGIFDILKYVTKIDYIFFHWIEKVPELKWGFLQSIFLFFLFPVLKLFNVKIIWTMHNKLSHLGKHPKLTRAIFKLMLRNSHIVLTHSSEGINFGRQFNSKSVSYTYYFPHPVKDRRLTRSFEKNTDILIWGTIHPYKGIDKFLDFIYKKKLEKKYKISIVGKVSSSEYNEKLQQFVNDNIRIENTFIEDDLLRDRISKSKLVLFTYSKASILSSGVLMDSLGYGANVLGPNVGAFADLAKDGVIDIYQDFEEMVLKLESQINDSTTPRKKSLDKFLIENSWEKYAENVYQILEKAK